MRIVMTEDEFPRRMGMAVRERWKLGEEVFTIKSCSLGRTPERSGVSVQELGLVRERGLEREFSGRVRTNQSLR